MTIPPAHKRLPLPRIPRPGKPEILAVLVVILLPAALWCIANFWLFKGLHGAERPVVASERSLDQKLREEFGWSSLPPSSVEHAWTFGFQGHVWLYRVRLTRDVFSSLRRSVLAAQGPRVVLNDQDDLSLCPGNFATSSRAVPLRGRLPSWWEAPSQRHFDSMLCAYPGGEFWFSYDTDKSVLFVLLTY